jgi:predicted RNase H-like HicB family nuclease
MTDYLVVYEQADNGDWGAYLPDLPGVIAGADTREEVERLIREGVAIYREEIGEGASIPEPVAHAGTISI